MHTLLAIRFVIISHTANESLTDEQRVVQVDINDMSSAVLITAVPEEFERRFVGIYSPH